MRDGRIADGFITAINACGNELAQHFPRTTTSNAVWKDNPGLFEGRSDSHQVEAPTTIGRQHNY